MFKSKVLALPLISCLSLFYNFAFADSKVTDHNHNHNHNQTHSLIDQSEVHGLLQQIVDVNLRFKNKFHTVLSESTLNKQTPHATVVMCSDSRVDMDILSDTPSGEIFVVRNIGNQIPTAYGSVEYGVDHLHTQLLLIVGHSECGAIKAAMQDYSDESKHIRTELNSLYVSPKKSLNYNLVKNINEQVAIAAKTFAKKVKAGKVVILGMLYDMHNDFKLGNGQLILVNINGEQNPAVLATNPYVVGLRNIAILNQESLN